MIFDRIFRLDGKVAVVTGGAGLIGQQICRAFAEAGAKVFIGEVNVADAEKLKEDLISDGLSVEVLVIDITEVRAIEKGVRTVLDREKKIDIWVNNAYPRTSDWGARIEDIKPDSFRKNVDMHMNGYFFCCQLVLDRMKESGQGILINMGSHYGVLGPNFSVYDGTEMTMPAAYSMIKGGIVNLTRYLATYYAKFGIRVNAVCPGGIFDNQNPVFVDKYNALTPMNRMGKPEEIAAPILFLCTEAASYITGQILMVDGGLSSW